MKPTESARAFASVIGNAWNQVYAWCQIVIAEGRIQATGHQFLFPNAIVVVETPKHFIYELVGLSRVPVVPLAIRHLKATSTASYFYQFPTDACPQLIVSNGVTMTGVPFGDVDDFASFSARFPSLVFRTSPFVYEDKGHPWIDFERGCCFLEKCDFMNRCGEIYRYKYVVHAGIVSRDQTPSDVLAGIQRRVKQGSYGVLSYPDEASRLMLMASQFASVYLTPGMPEVDIGKFVAANPEVLLVALGLKNLISEPYLRWIDGVGVGTDEAINPDLFLQDASGAWHIGDLKLPKLDKVSLTKGEMRRRRFVDDVNEGIAQLAHYREYFSTPGNAQEAQEKYNIIVTRPKLYLVVGTMENLPEEELREASRALGADIYVVSYDAINSLLARASTTR